MPGLGWGRAPWCCVGVATRNVPCHVPFWKWNQKGTRLADPWKHQYHSERGLQVRLNLFYHLDASKVSSLLRHTGRIMMYHFSGIELPSGLSMICYDQLSVDFPFCRDRRIMPQQDAWRWILKYIRILLVYSILWSWRFLAWWQDFDYDSGHFAVHCSCKSRLVAPTKDVGERISWKVACGIKSLEGNSKIDCDEKMRMLKLHVKTSYNILLFFATVLNSYGMFFQRIRKTVTIGCSCKSYYTNMPWEHTKDWRRCLFRCCQETSAESQLGSLVARSCAT